MEQSSKSVFPNYAAMQFYLPPRTRRLQSGNYLGDAFSPKAAYSVIAKAGSACAWRTVPDSALELLVFCSVITVTAAVQAPRKPGRSDPRPDPVTETRDIIKLKITAGHEEATPAVFLKGRNTWCGAVGGRRHPVTYTMFI